MERSNEDLRSSSLGEPFRLKGKAVPTGWKTLVVVSLILFCAASYKTAEAQEVSFSGWFHVIWGDSLPGPSASGVEEYIVIDDQSRWVSLHFGDGSGIPQDTLDALNRKRVRVTGQWESVRPLGRAPSQNRPRFQPSLIELELSKASALGDSVTSALGVSGSQRWVNILCRFADSRSVTPRSRAFVQALMSNVFPGMDHYWRESSFRNINLAGSVVAGWYNLPQPRYYYVYDRTGDGIEDLDFDRAVQDCTGAADADVFFPDFAGINLMFNDLLDCCAWGGSADLTRDGQTKVYRMTWLPPWGYQNQAVIAHEMGHGFGLPHSSGPYGVTYDSRWDVMSNVWGNCSPPDPVFGCIGVQTISYHKDRLGWIPGSRSLVAAPGGPLTIFLDRLGQPASGNNDHMVTIPIGGSASQFYTVEARRFTGYDGNLPGEAVIIHRVDTTQSRPAQVVDVDNNGDPNDAAAMWLPGETFIDAENGIVVSVDAVTPTGFQVTVMLDDVAPPSAVGLATPASGQIISGTFAFKATAEDNSGMIEKMEFYVDADSIPACTDSAPKVSGSMLKCNWNAASKPNGPHRVTAKAYDRSGNSAVSSPVSFNVNNGLIALVRPGGGENWRIRSRQLIRWNSSRFPGGVEIDISRDGGTSWSALFNKTSNDRSQNWTVKGPATIQARIRICSLRDPTICDISDGNFIIR